MAINVDTQDLENYPGTIKRVTLDQEQVVPTGYEGDEQFMLSFSTTAYSDNVNRTRIQDLYVTGYKAGWCRSSGFTGSAGKFDLTSSANTLRIKLDATVSGSDGSGYYPITLDYNIDTTPIAGEIVAADMEIKIRALVSSLNTADAGLDMAYRNASVEYLGGKFWIISGTVSPFFSGSNRSSVKILPGATNDASAALGFDLATDSESLASAAVKEALVSTNYTVGNTTLYISTGTSVAIGDCMMITDGTNTDYFPVLGVATDTDITVPVSGTNGFDGISNNYTANEAKVQILKEQDPSATPTMYYDSIDKITRFGLKSIINQIDYSS